MIVTEHYLAITILDSKKTKTLLEVLNACVTTGCQILNSRMNTLGEETAMMLLVMGNWGAVAKLEASLAILERRLGKNIQVKRTQAPEKEEASWMSYTVQLIAIDRPALLSDITSFLGEYGVQIEELSVNTYLSQLGTRMVNVNLKANIPGKVHLASFKEQLMAFCDERNVDVYLDPVRLYA
ncbi:MAG: hypothetical protein RLZ35_725 [Pseudomonadota bacterium]|jgi:glycine cleavage system transcriptional repressor